MSTPKVARAEVRPEEIVGMTSDAGGRRHRKAHTCSSASGQKGVDWSAVPLGAKSDSAIARELGVTPGAVRKARIKIGTRLTTMAERWEGTGVGSVSDQDVADARGVSRSTVSRIRRSLGMHGPQTVNWDEQPLGQVPDAVLARLHGVDPSVVGSARRRRGIPRGDLQWVTTEGEPATYPEACIDLWFHEHQIPHQFQQRVGTFVADWVLQDEVVEYAGLVEHKVLGSAYREKIDRKRDYYGSLGFRVRFIRPHELESFMPVGTPTFVARGRECASCGTSFTQQHRQHAKGLCRRCYRRGTR